MVLRQADLAMNGGKTKTVVTDFRETSADHTMLTIDGTAVQRVISAEFLELRLTSRDHVWHDDLVPTQIISALFCYNLIQTALLSTKYEPQVPDYHTLIFVGHIGHDVRRTMTCNLLYIP